MDYGIQASLRKGEDPLINVRGANAAEFEENLDFVAGKLEKIKAVAADLNTVPTGVGLIEQELGGQTIAEIPTPGYPPAQPQQWPQPQPVWNTPVPPVAQPAPMMSTYCSRCMTAPVCSTCGQGANPSPKSVKNGQYHIHECPTGNRDHKGQWCNPPKG
ncbi:hypothetical protein [Herbidospora cretacea]|uniref:hypothetical protein n=1 Tax=Herbidospora cretacea TaxID=28444 RepID=UPI000A41B1FB|nr:hypothetical protein [Herbidospora cretacea]